MVTDCGASFIKSLDFECILINNLAGNFNVFVFISLIFIAGAAGFFRMSGIVTVFMISLFLIIMSKWITGGLLFIVMMIIPLVLAYNLRRFLRI